MSEREIMLDEVREIDTETLARQVIGGSYTPGLHDVVLLERCKEIDDYYPTPGYTPPQQAAQLFRMHSDYVIGQLSHQQLNYALTAIQTRLSTEFNERGGS